MLLEPVYKLGSIVVIAVTLWLSGFGCSFCCATGVTDSCCPGNASTLTQASASDQTYCNSSSDDGCCCKPSVAISESVVSDRIIQGKGAIGCSLLPSQLEGIASHLRLADELALHGGLPESPYINSQIRTNPPIDAPLPHNRGGTYLRCCVLLI